GPQRCHRAAAAVVGVHPARRRARLSRLERAGHRLRLDLLTPLVQHLAHARAEEPAEEHAAGDASGTAAQRGPEEPAGGRTSKSSGRSAGAHTHAAGLAAGERENQEGGRDGNESLWGHERTSYTCRVPYHHGLPRTTDRPGDPRGGHAA